MGGFLSSGGGDLWGFGGGGGGFDPTSGIPSSGGGGNSGQTNDLGKFASDYPLSQGNESGWFNNLPVTVNGANIGQNATSVQQILALAGSLGPLINAGGNVFGATQALQQQNFLNSGKTSVQNTLNNLGTQSQSNIAKLQPLLDFLATQSVQGAQNYNNNSGGATGTASNVLNSAANPLTAFKTMLDPNGVPGLGASMGTSNALQQYLGNLIGGATQGLGPGASALQSAFAGGLNPATAIANGQAPGASALQTTGANLLGGSQNNPYVNALQSAGLGSITHNGYTPQLNAVTQAAQGLLSPQPAIQQAQSVAGQILGKNPLLPMDEVVSRAIDQNATQSKQQAAALKRQLFDRTGTTGSTVVGSGGANELLNGLGNQALQNQASAVTNAKLGQQALQEQLFGQGASLFNSAANTGLGYQGTGLNAVLGGANQAANLQQILGNLGLGGGNLGLNQAATGGSLLNSANQTQLGGLNALTGLGGLGNQNYLGGLGAINNLSGTNNSATNSLMQTLLATQGLGLNQNSGGYNALQGLLGTLTAGAGQGIQEQQASTQPISQQLQQWIEAMQGAAGNQVGLYGTAAPTNYFRNILG